jgi:dTDP-4-dehydrorhamnose reductase
MRVLVTGAGGQVGREVTRQVPAAVTVSAADHERLDITDAAAVAAALAGSGADLVVNCAAYTAVDRAETEEPAARRINADGPAILARACAGSGIPLIHLSTDYVFDGAKPTAYDEADPVTPLGVYGITKALGEAAIRAELDQHVILRTSWVFGRYGANFVKTMLRLGRERPRLRVVADQMGCPTAAADIAAAIWHVAAHLAAAPATARPVWGTYHFCGHPATSWHGFATAIIALQAERTGRPAPVIEAISSAQYPTPAPRPKNSVLATARFETAFAHPASAWAPALREVVRQLEEDAA